MMASTILQLSLMLQAKVLSSSTFKLQPFSLATSKDLSTLSFIPSYQYSFMKFVFLSIMEQRLALQILSRQSVMVVGCILQQLITRSGRQPYDQWQVFLLTPHRIKGMSIFLERSTLSNSCIFLNFYILSLSYSLTYSRSITLSTEQTPPSCCLGLLMGGIMSSRLFYTGFFQRSPLLKLNASLIGNSC